MSSPSPYQAEGRVDFEHSRSIVISTVLTPVALYREVAASLPFGASALFKLRDGLCRRLGLNPIGPMNGRETLNDGRLTKLDFFEVVEHDEDHLLLGACDTHLDSFLTLRVQRGEDRSLVTVSSRVRCKNWIGKAYMIPVGSVHRILVMRLLARLRKRFPV